MRLRHDRSPRTGRNAAEQPAPPPAVPATTAVAQSAEPSAAASPPSPPGVAIAAASPPTVAFAAVPAARSVAPPAVAVHRPAPSDEPDLYDLIETPAPKPKRAIPLPPPEVNYATPAGSPSAPSAADSAAASPYLPYRKKLAEEPKAAPPPPSVLRDVALPIALIVVGIALNIWDASYQGPDNGALPVSMILAPVLIQMLTSVVLVVASVIGGSALAGIAFTDPLWKTILKLSAIALVPGPVGSLLGHYIGDMNGSIAATFSSVILYIALLWTLIRLAAQDYVVCVALIWIIRTLVLYVIYKIQSARMGSGI